QGAVAPRCVVAWLEPQIFVVGQHRIAYVTGSPGCLRESYKNVGAAAGELPGFGQQKNGPIVLLKRCAHLAQLKQSVRALGLNLQGSLQRPLCAIVVPGTACRPPEIVEYLEGIRITGQCTIESRLGAVIQSEPGARQSQRKQKTRIVFRRC